MQRIKIVLEYDGTAYSGWQIQNGQSSVQEKLETALQILFKKPVRVTAAGRTDAGVHARNQVVHCDIESYDIFKLKRSLNGLVAQDIVVKEIITVAPGFHARFDASSRRYRYYISKEKTALNRLYSWTIHYPLNLTLMQAGADLIPEFEDFKSFCKVKSEVNHHICNIMKSRWLSLDNLLIYEIQANRFLHGMVRAIVGTLVELGRGKISLSDLANMIEAKNRELVPATAPAKGLVLEQITY